MPIDMKLMIASTFANISQKKSVDKITVKDLVEECGISRQTFYYHFKDILEVMEWCIGQVLHKSLQNSLNANTPQELIEEFIRSATKYGNILLKLLNSNRRPQIESIFVDAMCSCIRQGIITCKPDVMLNYNDLSMAVKFYAYGMTGVILENANNSNIDHKKLSNQLYQLISSDIFSK